MVLFLSLLFSPTAEAACPSDVSVVDRLTCSSSYAGRILATAESELGGECDASECYACGVPHAEEPQYGAEDVYSFRCQHAGEVTMMITDLPCDLDIYVLDETCDPYAGCLYGSTAPYADADSVTFDCVPGEDYFVVVEAYGVEHLDVASGPCMDESGVIYDPTYTLSFDVSASTGCNEDCGDEEDNDLDGLTDCADPDCVIDDPCCDMDDDGYDAEMCGGTDCDDDDATISPGATDVPDNGIDEDCSGDDAEPEEPDDLDDPPDDTDEPDDDGATPGGATDTGTDDAWPADGDETQANKGCGCAAGSPSTGMAWLGLFGLVAWGRRRMRDETR